MEVQFFGLVGDLHSSVPKVSVLQLEEKGCVADVEVYHFLALVTLANDLSHEIYGFIHLHPDFCLDSHLPVFVRAPSVQFTIVHKGDRKGLATLYLFDLKFFLISQVFKMFVEGGNIIVFVVAVSENSIFTVAPVVNLIFIVEDDAEISSSSDSLDIVAVERLHLCGLRYDLWNVSAVSGWTNGVYEEFEEEADILTSIAEGIDLTLVGEDDSMTLSRNCVLDFDVVLLKIIDDFGLALVLCVSMAEFSVSTAAQRVQISN